MTKRTYKAVGLHALVGETIERVEHGSDVMDRLNTYNGYTLHTKSGKEFVVWNSMGETNLNEITTKEG